MSVCHVGMRMLVPVDGSKNSAHALKTAVQMAKEFGGRITLVHVVPLAPTETRFALPSEYSDILEATHKAGAELLASFEKELKAEGVKVETLLRSGHVVEQIIKASEEGEFDLIVIGARGISSVRELLLGSVSDGVTRHAKHPVLVVK